MTPFEGYLLLAVLVAGLFMTEVVAPRVKRRRDKESRRHE